MIFGIDASSANKPQKTGVEWYAYSLIQAMKDFPLHSGERVVLYSPTPLEGELAELPEGWSSEVLSWPLSKAWMQGRMSWEMFRRPPNVLFVPAQGLPRIVPRDRKKQQATVTTVHDVGFARAPDVYEPSVRRRISTATKRSVRLASHIITVSEFSKQELREVYALPSDRISVTPLAFDHTTYQLMSDEDVARVRVQHRVGARYFLFVGRLEAKKNISLLVKMFKQFKEKRGSGDPYELVLVGSPGYRFSEVEEHLKDPLIAPYVRQLGYLPSEEIAALMNGASAFLFPSVYEGFGIPNLEALACGSPVIASDIPVHREVLGDMVLYADPDSASAWVHEMEQVVSDKTLRETHRTRGIERAAGYTWERTAEQTWKVLREAVK